MDMTFDQYILNPMGKNNAVLSSIARENIRKTYMVKFDNILLREHGRIEYNLYKDQKSNTYWAHIKVPSEVVKDFYYDVVLKFFANEKVGLGGEDLFKYQVKFYSNDPSFVYTYAHVFRNNNLFINELSSKMSKEALRKAPKEKNPTNDVGYVKALYFAYLIMQNRKLNKKSKFENESKPLDLKTLIYSIEDADEKIRKRQEEGAKVSKRKKIVVDKSTARNLIGNIKHDVNMDRLQVTTTKAVTKIKRSTNINKSKTVGSVKRK